MLPSDPWLACCSLLVYEISSSSSALSMAGRLSASKPRHRLYWSGLAPFGLITTLCTVRFSGSLSHSSMKPHQAGGLSGSGGLTRQVQSQKYVQANSDGNRMSQKANQGLVFESTQLLDPTIQLALVIVTSDAISLVGPFLETTPDPCQCIW